MLPPVPVGSKLAFVATFLGRTLADVYEVRELVPGERFVMSTADGPFAMETTYTWQDEPGEATRMRLRNRGEPSGFSALAAPLMPRALRAAPPAGTWRASRPSPRRPGRQAREPDGLYGPIVRDGAVATWSGRSR
jgi:hypothetical protein